MNYRTRQFWRDWWLYYLILGLVTLMLVYGIGRSIILGNPEKDACEHQGHIWLSEESICIRRDAIVIP